MVSLKLTEWRLTFYMFMPLRLTPRRLMSLKTTPCKSAGLPSAPLVRIQIWCFTMRLRIVSSRWDNDSGTITFSTLAWAIFMAFKMASPSFALVKFALERLAFSKFADWRSAAWRSALWAFAFDKSALPIFSFNSSPPLPPFLFFGRELRTP